jgi:ABC-type polysaccharide/polyol phosphate export permease
VIVNLYRHRSYIWRTALSEVRHRYAGAGLGVLWNFVQPLAQILIFTLIFTKVMAARVEGLGAAYPVWLCAALLPWAAFSECLTRCTGAFVASAQYLRKLPIPEQVFVAQAALTSALNLALSFVLLLAVALAMGHTPTWHWVLLPIPLVMLIALAFGLGTVLGTLNAFFRDVGQVVPIALQLGFWLFPIVYHPSFLPDWLRQLLPWNPVYPSLASIRLLFINGVVPGWELWAGMTAWAAAAGILGYAVLRRLRPELRDVI